MGITKIVGWTSRDFLDPQGKQKESRRYIVFSLDQRIGELLGLWLRFGSQEDDAPINFENIYSGGIEISGKLWGREKDNIGLGYAYLNGGNLEIDDIQVVESYMFALPSMIIFQSRWTCNTCGKVSMTAATQKATFMVFALWLDYPRLCPDVSG